MSWTKQGEKTVMLFYLWTINPLQWHWWRVYSQYTSCLHHKLWCYMINWDFIAVVDIKEKNELESERIYHWRYCCKFKYSSLFCLHFIQALDNSSSSKWGFIDLPRDQQCKETNKQKSRGCHERWMAQSWHG
jgi:hypothetical protein